MVSPTKWCPRCEDDRPISEFYLNKGRSDGLSPLCVVHAREADAQFRQKVRAELLACFPPGCAIAGCPNDDPRGMCVDHVNGGGKAERDSGVWGASRRFVNQVKARPNEYQLLCAYHNQIKKIEEREHTGRRIYVRQAPTEKKQGIGRGNSPAQRAALESARTPEAQAARGRLKKGRPQPKVAAVRTGTKMVTDPTTGNRHWSRPGDPDYPEPVSVD